MESGWNLWVWLLGVVVRWYIDFLILLIPTPLVSVFFYSCIPTFCSLKKNVFRSCTSLQPHLVAIPTSHTHLLITTPTSHTHTFHPLSTIVIHTLNFAQVKSMDDNCGEWVECMGVASGCGEQEVGVASGSWCGYWVWL